ncbi:MAG: LPS export ABC transporter periplasmic protein LptC [Burkholderiaceae bacterium]|nr:LPS export ABC transporter periplasmic protein LptC [Burkholderiaceae bacterium]
MHRKTVDRARLAALMAAGALFALGSFWLLHVVDRDGAAPGAPARGESDYFVDNFSVVRMTPAGKPAYLVSGARLTHHPQDDSSDIERPFVRKLNDGLAPTDMRAERARVDQGNSRVLLSGNVTVERAASAGARQLRLTTPELTVFPELDRMQTDAPVETVSGAARLSGVGMTGDNAARRIEIAHRLRLTYPPAPR